jgi:hypothetical protein
MCNTVDSQVDLWQMNGPQIAASGSFGSISGWSIVSAHADYDGDGRSDILWRNTAGRLDLWLMNGTASSFGEVVSDCASVRNTIESPRARGSGYLRRARLTNKAASQTAPASSLAVRRGSHLNRVRGGPSS